MRRHLPPILVLGLDTALMVAGHPDGVQPWVAALYLVVAGLVVLAMTVWRRPVPALALALLLASISGSGHVLLIWAAYQAARQAHTRTRRAMLVGAAVGGLAAQLAVAALPPRTPLPDVVQRTVAIFVVFVALPLLAGRYVAQHERLVAVLEDRNRELRGQRHLVAEQERLRERLRIARDMHDSLGQRLSLISVQAAALEVAQLPPPQRLAVGQLAQAARGAIAELHDLVGTLRRDPGPDRQPGIDDIGTLVDEFVAAGVPATLSRHGTPGPVAGSGGHAAYRVVQEGLTNAARHAPGKPVTISLHWEPDTLLVTIANPLSAPAPEPSTGHGLAGLAERVELAGGYLDRQAMTDAFRVVAMLPTIAGEAPEVDDPTTRRRRIGLAVAVGALMFVLLPAGLLVGVR